MRDPERLLDGAGTEIERSLLDAARAEMPDAVAKRHVAAALGIGAVSAWPTIGYAATKGSKAGMPMVLKLLALGAVGAGAWGTAEYVLSRPEPTVVETTKGSTPVRSVPPTRNPAPNAAAVPAEQPKVITPIESLERAEPEQRAPSAQAPSAAAQPASIADEIRMLDAARKAKAGGDAAGAIRALDEYRRRFPRGALAEESVLLRIEALARLGNTGAARKLADRFRASHPNSPHLRRIDSVLGEP